MNSLFLPAPCLGILLLLTTLVPGGPTFHKISNLVQKCSATFTCTIYIYAKVNPTSDCQCCAMQPQVLVDTGCISFRGKTMGFPALEIRSVIGASTTLPCCCISLWRTFRPSLQQHRPSWPGSCCGGVEASLEALSPSPHPPSPRSETSPPPSSHQLYSCAPPWPDWSSGAGSRQILGNVMVSQMPWWWASRCMVQCRSSLIPGAIVWHWPLLSGHFPLNLWKIFLDYFFSSCMHWHPRRRVYFSLTFLPWVAIMCAAQQD